MVMIAWWGRWGSNWTNTEPEPSAILRVHATVARKNMPKAVVTR